MKSEQDVWKLVRKVRSIEAYETYMARFPNGPHHHDAFVAKYRLKGLPFPPPQVFVPPPPPAPPAPIPPCTQLLVDHELERVASEEAEAFRAVERANRIADFQAFIDRFPAGVCRDRVIKKLETRKARKDRIPPIAGLGPLAAHRLTTNFVIEEDYPIAAIDGGEEGQVAVEWDVTEDGFAESCRVIRSSGSKALDEATCRIVGVRLRYDPARDSMGGPIRAKDNLTITWVIPEDEPVDPAKAVARAIGNQSSD